MTRLFRTYQPAGLTWIVGLCAVLLALCSLTGCNTTKFVPEGQYLLNKAYVKCEDDKHVNSAGLRSYLRQKQNTEILGFWKLQLDVYNTAPLDTTTKSKRRLARNAKKMGEAPVIYDEELTVISMQQLRQQMSNEGYFNAVVDTQKVFKGRKLNLTYNITANEPYRFRNYEVDIDESAVAEIARNEGCLVKSGEQFSTETLDDERERIISYMRNRGYFYVEKSMLDFVADSTLDSHEVDVKIRVAPYVSQLDSQAQARLRTKYTIRRVCYQIDYDPSRLPDSVVLHRDSDKYGNEYSWTGRSFLRKNALRRASRIRPGTRYSEWRVERTYAHMNALPPVKYVDIVFQQVGDTLLDCYITVSRGRLNSVGIELGGTYSAGDWGIAVGLNYSNKNIFHGAELLTIGTRASYEWRSNGGRAIEASVDAGLKFPSQVGVNLAYNFQQRPGDYTRHVARATLGYDVPRKPGTRWTHHFDLLDFNYIYVPWMSDEFILNFVKRSSMLLASYEDHFILDWSYTGSISTYDRRHPNRSYNQFSFRVETAGNALYGIAKAAKLPTDSVGIYTLGKVPFAQYVKGDINYTFHGIITPKHHLLGHIGLGVAVPYGNSDVLPYDRRYFGGGSNSIRGWQARTLGPGKFNGLGNKRIYDLQVGDIKLDMNLEYRYKVLSFLELAAFLDAGNIWTIREYPSQPGGEFLWNEFYKQIAWSYGVGIRFDLSILIFRVDFGVKLHDPARIDEGKQWRTAANGLGWKDDMTFHFAIGYPF